MDTQNSSIYTPEVERLVHLKVMMMIFQGLGISFDYQGFDFQVGSMSNFGGVYVRYLGCKSCQNPMGKSGHKNPPRPWRELGLMDGMTHRRMVPWL